MMLILRCPSIINQIPPSVGMHPMQKHQLAFSTAVSRCLPAFASDDGIC